MRSSHALMACGSATRSGGDTYPSRLNGWQNGSWSSWWCAGYFSEWLSLLVKTRSSQAIKRLLDFQPDVARVVRDGAEREVPRQSRKTSAGIG